MIGFAAIMAFFLAQAAAVITMGQYAEREVVEVAERNTLAQISLIELSALAQQIRRDEKEYFIFIANTEKRDQQQKEWGKSMTKITTLLHMMQANVNSAFNIEDAQNITRWSLATQFYSSEMNKIFQQIDLRAKLEIGSANKPNNEPGIPLQNSNSSEERSVRMYTSIEANEMIKAGKDQFSKELIKGVTDALGAKNQATLALASVANEGFAKMIYGIAVTIIFGTGIGAYLLITLMRNVTRPIEELTKSVDAMSNGDSTVRTSSTVSVREFHALTSAIERMRVAQEIMIQRMLRRMN